MPVCNLAPREVILADVLRNSLAHISPLLPDTTESCWIDFAATDCEDLICLHPRVLPFSSTLLHLPPACSVWQEPSQLGINPAARFPFLPFITLRWHRLAASWKPFSGRPVGFPLWRCSCRACGQGTYVYTHTHTRARSERIPRSIVDISFAHFYLSIRIHPSLP